VSVTDDVDCIKCDRKAHRRHLRRGSPLWGSEADSNQNKLLRVLTIALVSCVMSVYLGRGDIAGWQRSW